MTTEVPAGLLYVLPVGREKELVLRIHGTAPTDDELFAWLRDIIPNGERFDTVVLDPAKLTRDREDVESALRKYCDMNRLALQVVKPGGIFLTCSCTGLVSEEQFLESVRRAAWQAGRTLQVFKISGAAADHPFLIHVQEGRYLKAVFCRVVGEAKQPRPAVANAPAAE